MAFFAHSRPVADGLVGGFRGLSLGDMFAAIKTWNDKRITRRELHNLSDHELSDIGLSRAEIDGVVDRLI